MELEFDYSNYVNKLLVHQNPNLPKIRTCFDRILQEEYLKVVSHYSFVVLLQNMELIVYVI